MATSPTSTAPHLEAFLNAARYFIGLEESGYNTFTDSRGQELMELWGSDFSGIAWCAIFVSACAAKAGILDTVISKSSAAGWIAASTVYYLGGTFIDGPCINGGVAVTPQPGDIINFGNYAYHGHEHAYHVGIVESVSDDKVHTIEGNTSNEYGVEGVWRHEYSLSAGNINVYVRPDWSKVGDIVGSSLGPLYATRNDRHDMTLRQVGYINSRYELSNSVSDIPVSIINYTSLLGDLYEIFAPYASTQVKIDTSQLPEKPRISVDYFMSVGYTASAACAITACLKTYSELQTSFVKDMGMIGGVIQRLQGIAAWNNTRWEWVKSRLRDGRYNLSDQLRCVYDEMEMNYYELVAAIKTSELNVLATQRAAMTMMQIYNNYYSMQSYLLAAKDTATTLFNALIITREQIGNSTTIYDENGNLLEPKSTVTVPSYVDQTGILYDADFTSYSYHYHVWGSGTTQRKLADEWMYEGCPHSKGIAMIDGYYCVAVKPIFGAVGDIIVVTLEDGTWFNAIIADEKGEDADSEWGHPKSSYGGAISIIEWERIKTDEDGDVVTEQYAISSSDVDYIGYGDGDVQIPEWFRKKVNNITNYGSYF